MGYQRYNEENTAIQREKEGSYANQTNIDSNLDEFAAYEEIYEHSHPKPKIKEKDSDNSFQMVGVCRNMEKSLRTDRNKPPGPSIQTINSDLPSVPENTGYLSAEVNVARQISSSNDSDSYQSVKFKHYQNEQGRYSPETKGLYESITDGMSTHEHHYTDLQPQNS